jgi:uncharacterized protein YfiM (DUF2279 family)
MCGMRLGAERRGRVVPTARNEDRLERTRLRHVGRIATTAAAALLMAQPCLGAGGRYHLLPPLDALPAPLGSGTAPCEQGLDPGESESPGNAALGMHLAAEPEGSEPRPNVLWAAIISTGIVGGMAINSLTDGDLRSYHFANEGWFGENTYVGGGDKASHFVSFEIIAREVDITFRYLGFSQRQSEIGGFVVSSLAGLTNELCDGANKYGFSYEDLIMDVLGAGTAVATSVTGTRDLFGFRFGLLPGPVPPTDPDNDGTGRDYSHEIYTADLKLGGMARRLGISDRLVRFLLASTTYGVSGYPYGSPEQRERLVGFEVGLNFQEILFALDVDQETWWGIVAHALFDNFRIPYTQLGFRYGLNHGNWYGPAVGGTTM